jgi:V/A-type H+-transporting ATPase subunit D
MLDVSPTRMELLKLKKRLKIARKGHKLLKDKLDQLMRILINYYKKIAAKREIFNKLYLRAVYHSELAVNDSFKEAVLSELTTLRRVPEIEQVAEKKLNVNFIESSLKIESVEPNYNLNQLSIDYNNALCYFDDSLAILVELASLEKSLMLTSDEVVRTKRRVNALEYILMPEIKETIKYIQMKLDEHERNAKTQIMKIKGSLKAPVSHSSAYPGKMHGGGL